MTEKALLNKAGRLAAEEHLILKDKRIPDSIAVKMTKPLASEQGRLVKRLRTGKTGPLTFRGTEESEGMVDAPVETLLKQIVKGVKKEPDPTGTLHARRQKGEKSPKPSTSGIKRETKRPKTPIPSKLSTSKSGGFRKAALSGASH